MPSGKALGSDPRIGGSDPSSPATVYSNLSQTRNMAAYTSFGLTLSVPGEEVYFYIAPANAKLMHNYL